MSENSQSTRQRTSPQAAAFPSQSDANTEKVPQSTVKNLPPGQKPSGLRKVSAPLSKTRLSHLIYLLAGLAVLLLGIYSYRLVQHKREVGGWWSLAMGRTPAQVHANTNYNADGGKVRKSEKAVEEGIEALASALGMPPNELASAIASGVRAYVPPASLSSVAAKETGELVNVLLSAAKDGEESDSSKSGMHTEAEESPGVVGGILRGVESFAGMDEPNY